jgi:hypothetical protein
MIAVTGTSGLIGSALVRALRGSGQSVRPLVRRSPEPGEAAWNPATGHLDPAALRGTDAVVHLAGVSLAGGLWTAERKRAIRDSRVRGTGLVAETMARTTDGPRVLVSASAVGYYGNRGDTLLTEQDGPGTGFLADVAQAWEAATGPAEAAGIRVVHLRFGVVLTPTGGALRLMLPLFRIGLGGPVGAGRHWMSWIPLDEAVQIVRTALDRDDLVGAINAVAPVPVTNEEFTVALASALRRPALVRTPAFVLEAVLGDLARETMLASTRVIPARLQAIGYRFRDATLLDAVRRLLG